MSVTCLASSVCFVSRQGGTLQPGLAPELGKGLSRMREREVNKCSLKLNHAGVLGGALQGLRKSIFVWFRIFRLFPEPFRVNSLWVCSDSWLHSLALRCSLNELEWLYILNKQVIGARVCHHFPYLFVIFFLLILILLYSHPHPKLLLSSNGLQLASGRLSLQHFL